MRLLDLGVEEFLLNAAVVSIIAQRLVRRVCSSCATPPEDSQAIKEEFGLRQLSERFGIAELLLLEANGCDKCAHTGYNGRLAVVEYLQCDDYLRSLSKDDQFLKLAKDHNKSRGGRNLLEDGLLKVILGQTTIEEVYRVCG